jgi:hypothetical protein
MSVSNEIKEIQDYIDECRYTYKVTRILEDYEKYYIKNSYCSCTMNDCIKRLEPQIRRILGMNDAMHKRPK